MTKPADAHVASAHEIRLIALGFMVLYETLMQILKKTGPNFVSALTVKAEGTSGPAQSDPAIYFPLEVCVFLRDCKISSCNR